MGSPDILWFVPFRAETECSLIKVMRCDPSTYQAKERGEGLADAIARSLDRTVFRHFAAKVAELAEQTGKDAPGGRRW